MSQTHNCIEVLKAELELTNKLLANYKRVLEAIPECPEHECPEHGECVPHALEWIENAKTNTLVTGTRPPTALEEVAIERQRQDGKWGGAEHDDRHSTAEFVQLIEDYAGWARTMAGMNSPAKARNRLIQVAALAIAAVESIDRKTGSVLA